MSETPHIESNTESKRKLVSVQRVLDVDDIVFINADGKEEVAANIVRITILGWQCVTQRSNGLKKDDLVLYHEIDSLIPGDQSAYQFLRQSPAETEFRLKTKKFKKQIAQGLVLPLNTLLEAKDIKEGSFFINDNGDAVLKYTTQESQPDSEDFREYTEIVLTEDTDVTDLLGVTKWELQHPAALAGQVKSLFPVHIVSKTDEERIQSCPRVLTKHKGTPIYFSEKLDGSSYTAFNNEGDFQVCSRNMSLLETEGNAFWQITREKKVDHILEHYNLALQGELVGPGVQGNKLKLPKLDLFIYNVWDIKERRYFDLSEFLSFCLTYNLNTVPILDRDVPLDFTVPDLVTYATRKSALNKNVWAEGVVVRAVQEVEDTTLGRLSFKVINPEFLLKFEA